MGICLEDGSEGCGWQRRNYPGVRGIPKGLAEAAEVETPTREELVRFYRKRKKKTSHREWVNPHDPDAKITKLKDGPVWGTRRKRRSGREHRCGK